MDPVDRRSLSAGTVRAILGRGDSEYRVRICDIRMAHCPFDTAHSPRLYGRERNFRHCGHHFFVPELQMVHLQDEGELSARVVQMHRGVRQHDGHRHLDPADHGFYRPARYRARDIRSIHRRRNRHGRKCNRGLPWAQKLLVR